jgi:sigma-B regulation protein RsbU (phosphoserine phosphatase)
LDTAFTSSQSLSPFAPERAERKVWLAHLEPVSLKAGETLFRQGDAADGIFFIESGELSIWLELPGDGRVKLRDLGPGQCLGEMALYRREARAASADAASHCRLWKLTAARLANLERDAPALASAMHRHVVGLLAERLAYSNQHVKDPLARLAHAIRDLAVNEFATPGTADPRIADAALRKDEVGAIAGAVQFLQQRLQSYLADLQRATSAREQIQSELRIAGRIQSSFLPAPLAASEVARVDFAAFSRPAREAGGDLYDGFFLDANRFFFVVGDVSGKGVPAALFMAVTAMCLRALAASIQPVGALLNRVNELLCQRNDTMQFVTVLAGVLDIATGEFSWTNCGHPAPIILGPSRALILLDEGRGPPAGVFDGADYATQHRTLGRDEILLVYTDGITEALDPDSALYGEERLEALFSGTHPSDARSCVERVVEDVERFVRGAPQADDLTLIALRPNRA